MTKKRIPILPLTDEKMRDYVEGRLRLVYRRVTGKHYFMAAERQSATASTRRMAYFRVWYFRKHLAHIPDACATLYKFFETNFDTRGPRKATIAKSGFMFPGDTAIPETTATVRVKRKYTRRVDRLPASDHTEALGASKKGRRSKVPVAARRAAYLAYKRGYNAAYRAGNKVKKVRHQSNGTSTQLVDMPTKHAVPVKGGLLGRLSWLILGS